MSLSHNYLQNKHTLWITNVNHGGKAAWGGFSSHSDWPHRSLWPKWDQPQPNLSSSSKLWWNPFGWQTKFTTHWVIHGDNHPTHTLHTTPGIAYALLHQEEQVTPLLLMLSLTAHFEPAPAILFIPFSFLLLSLTFKQTSNYPRVSVLGCWDSACHDHKWPYSNHIKWNHITIKWVICMQYGWINIGSSYLFTTKNVVKGS